MNSINIPGARDRVAISWIVAGLALLVLVGVSISAEEPPREVPVYAIDEELAPLQSGALEREDQYADLVEPASYDPDTIRTGVAP